MELKEKVELIQSLSEADLREGLLIPLFTKMGFIDPILHHHSNEKGKDIILKEFDPKFKKTYYLSVVVKAGNVNGSASGNSSYFTLLNQIRQSFNEPYKHVYDLKEIEIDQVLVVISGKFLPTALESIYGSLKAERLDKAIREPIDINKLPNLIDEYFPEYWDEFENPKAELLKQRNQLLNNLGKLSKVLFPDSKDQERFLNKVSLAEFDVDLMPYERLTKYIAEIGYTSISIDEIDEYYTDTSISNYYSDIKKHFFEIKKKARDVLYNLDEVIEILKAILIEKNPQKMVELTMDLNDYIGGGYYGGRGFHFSSNDIEWQEEFGDGLKEYQAKKETLLEAGLLDFYHSIFHKIRPQAIKQLQRFYNEHPKDHKDVWLGMSISFDLTQKVLKGIEFYTFIETPKVAKQQEEHIGRNQKEIERLTELNDSLIKVEYAVNCYGFFKEDEFTNEKKAESFTWHYEQGFEKMFLKTLGYEIL